MFEESHQSDVDYQDCQLRGADFYRQLFKKVTFKECDLEEAVFEETDLKGIDLSSCYFSQLIVDINRLKGCTINHDQSSVFLSKLGLILKD